MILFWWEEDSEKLEEWDLNALILFSLFSLIINKMLT